MNRSVNRVILWALARVARMALPAHVVIFRSERLKVLRIFKRTLLPALCGWLANAGPAAEFSTEEFVGPFPNRADARRNYGAVGDGKADDTAALQKGLDELNTSKKEAAPKGFEFLANIGDHPDAARSASGAGPLDNRGTVDDATLLRHLVPLREARVWLPDGITPTNVTDLRIHRVMAGGGRGAVVEFLGKP